MASQAVTLTPTILAGITAGTNYTFQNRSGGVIFIQATDTAPTDASGAFVVSPAPMNDSSGIVQAAAGEDIYIWGIAAQGIVVYDEAP